MDLALALEVKTARIVGDGDLKLEMSVAEVRALISAAPAVDESAKAAARFVPPL